MINIASSKIVTKFFLILLVSCMFSGCAIFQGKSTPQQYSQDTAITTTIKTKFVQSDMISAPTIHVETQNGIVQLTGFVSSRAQVREAQQIAQSTQGVRGVVNSIIVQPRRYR